MVCSLSVRFCIKPFTYGQPKNNSPPHKIDISSRRKAEKRTKKYKQRDIAWLSLDLAPNFRPKITRKAGFLSSMEYPMENSTTTIKKYTANLFTTIRLISH